MKELRKKAEEYLARAEEVKKRSKEGKSKLEINYNNTYYTCAELLLHNIKLQTYN